MLLSKCLEHKRNNFNMVKESVEAKSLLSDKFRTLLIMNCDSMHKKELIIKELD